MLEIVRKRKIYALEVEIGERPEDNEAMSAKKTQRVQEPIAQPTENWRGLEVSDITQDIADRFKLSPGSGVIVMRVEQGSAAEEAGIRAGDIIYEINRQPVKNITDYNNAIKGLSGDVLVGTYRGYVVIKEK